MTNSRLTILLFALLLILGPITAQDNQEPPHAHFLAEPNRGISLAWEDVTDNGAVTMAVFTYLPQWEGKQVFVRIPGTPLPYTLYINDFRFGSDPGSRNMALFNLTPFLKEGANQLRLDFLITDTSGSPVSCRFSGEPVLIVRNAILVKDHVITAYQSPETSEVLLRFHLFVKSYLSRKNKGRSLEIKVTCPDGDQVVSETRDLNFPLSYGQETEMVFDRTLENPVLWATGNPGYYTTAICISEKKGGSSETITSTFGIRTARISDSLLFLNSDTIRIEPAGDQMVDSLYCLTGKKILSLFTEQGFNALITAEPIPYRVVDLLGRNGIVVIRNAGRMDQGSGRDLANCPSVIWTE